MPKTMGTFYVGCKVENHKDPKRAAVVPKLLVETGSEFTWLPAEVLERIGLEPAKKDLQIQMANGQIVTRTVGYAILRVDKYETTDEVVFAQRQDVPRLGWRALRGMNVRVDARHNRLVAAGPVPAASGASISLARGAYRKIPDELKAPLMAPLINTPLQRGARKCGGALNRFSGFDGTTELRNPLETAEVVLPRYRRALTPLKRGVNKSRSRAALPEGRSPRFATAV